MPYSGGEKIKILLGVMLLLVATSALAVVYNSYLNRQLFITLNTLGQEYHELRVDYGRLQLEYGSWASPAFIESVAANDLRMTMPDSGQIVIVSSGQSSAVEHQGQNFVAVDRPNVSMGEQFQ